MTDDQLREYFPAASKITRKADGGEVGRIIWTATTRGNKIRMTEPNDGRFVAFLDLYAGSLRFRSPKVYQTELAAIRALARTIGRYACNLAVLVAGQRPAK